MMISLIILFSLMLLVTIFVIYIKLNAMDDLFSCKANIWLFHHELYEKIQFLRKHRNDFTLEENNNIYKLIYDGLEVICLEKNVYAILQNVNKHYSGYLLQPYSIIIKDIFEVRLQNLTNITKTNDRLDKEIAKLK